MLSVVCLRVFEQGCYYTQNQYITGIGLQRPLTPPPSVCFNLTNMFICYLFSDKLDTMLRNQNNNDQQNSRGSTIYNLNEQVDIVGTQQISKMFTKVGKMMLFVKITNIFMVVKNVLTLNNKIFSDKLFYLFSPKIMQYLFR